MKTLVAQNGEKITLSDEHAEYFLSKHSMETSSQMRWTIAVNEFEKNNPQQPLSVDRPGSVLHGIINSKSSVEKKDLD